jgi:hypothetical protein
MYEDPQLAANVDAFDPDQTAAHNAEAVARDLDYGDPTSEVMRDIGYGEQRADGDEADTNEANVDADQEDSQVQSSVPTQFQIDERVRLSGLQHVEELRAKINAQRQERIASRRPSFPPRTPQN